MKKINRKKRYFIESTCKQSSVIILFICIFMFLPLILLTGCSQNQKTAVNKVSTEKTAILHTMKAAEDVLVKMSFEIEKADYNEGYIRTRPLAGAQFFEVWRRDNVGAENQLLANMHSIRRIVELDISEQNNELKIDCKVHVQRLSIPQRETTSSARAYGMFTRSSRTLQRLMLNSEQEKGLVWVELDNDARLPQEILKRIFSAMDKSDKATVGVGDKQ
jgi:hypothetical protein